MLILDRKQISSLLPKIELVTHLEQGFVDYSQGRCIVPPVGELLLEKGEVHIKYGCVRGDRFYVVKVASGFYQNHQLGLPSSNGLMQLFEQKTGQLAAILLDEGLLTDIRTAVAGAICAKYLAPQNVQTIGIVGTGTQARLQAEYVSSIVGCRHLAVWGRNKQKAIEYQRSMSVKGFHVRILESVQQLCQDSRLIVTTTPSCEPLINAGWVRPGTHITAVGADTPNKQELDTQLLANAHLVVADSIEQCLYRGEIANALNGNHIKKENVVELGHLIGGGGGREHQNHITIADLTGVAVQDVNIAESVFLIATT